jgi:site-specific DNA-methyltransferase (adenine-specific)
MLAFALRADGWYLRQDIIWAKKNPMPESVTDRCTKSHEYIFLLSKIPGYYYDTEAIKESCAISSSWQPHNRECRYGGRKYTESPDEFYRTKSGNAYDFRERVNKRDVWRVSNAAFKEAHFAVFPPDLIKPCILAGCPTGGTVLDPFLGSGTTAAVALSLDRHFIGVELNPEYIEIAERRIHPLMAQIKMDLEVKTNGKSL